MGSNIIKAFLISNSELDPQVTFIFYNRISLSKKKWGQFI